MNWKIFRSVLPLVALVAFAYYTTSMKEDYAAKDPVLILEGGTCLIYKEPERKHEYILV